MRSRRNGKDGYSRLIKNRINAYSRRFDTKWLDSYKQWMDIILWLEEKQKNEYLLYTHEQ